MFITHGISAVKHVSDELMAMYLGEIVEFSNSCYMLAAGQCGTKHDGPTYGKSLIFDHWGNVVQKLQTCHLS